jgi:hypothetical protein
LMAIVELRKPVADRFLTEVGEEWRVKSVDGTARLRAQARLYFGLPSEVRREQYGNPQNRFTTF